MLAAIVIGQWRQPGHSWTARQTRRRILRHRWTRRPALHIPGLAVTVLITPGQVARNLRPVLERLSLELARPVVNAPHPFRTAAGGDRPEGGRFRLPPETVRIEHVQPKVRRTLDLGAVNAGVRAQTERVAVVVELLILGVHLPAELALVNLAAKVVLLRAAAATRSAVNEHLGR